MFVFFSCFLLWIGETKTYIFLCETKMNGQLTFTIGLKIIDQNFFLYLCGKIWNSSNIAILFKRFSIRSFIRLRKERKSQIKIKTIDENVGVVGNLRYSIALEEWVCFARWYIPADVERHLSFCRRKRRRRRVRAEFHPMFFWS